MTMMFPYAKPKSHTTRAGPGRLLSVSDIQRMRRVRQFRSLGEGGLSQEELVRRWQADVQSLSDSWHVGETIGDVRRYAGMLSTAKQIYDQLGSLSTDADVYNLLENLATLASAVGPVGQMAAWYIRAAATVAEVLTSHFPAYARQLQAQNYLYLTRWLAESVMDIHGADGKDSGEVMVAQGWLPVFVTGPVPFCKVSGGAIADWSIRRGIIPASVEDNETLFGLAVGSRYIPEAFLSGDASAMTEHDPNRPPTSFCESMNLSDNSWWMTTPQGAESMEQGLALARRLAPDGYAVKTPLAPGQPANSIAYIGENLVFFNNLEYDINPGYGTDFIWLGGFIINLTALPDSILFPLGSFLTLTGERAATLRGARISDDDKHAIRDAAFGPQRIPTCTPAEYRDWFAHTSGAKPCMDQLTNEKFLEWNLLWLLYQQYWRNDGTISSTEFGPYHSWEQGYSFDVAGPAILAEMGARAKIAAAKAAKKRGGILPVAAGLGAAGILAWLLLK